MAAQSSHPYISEYATDFQVPAGFGRPGAVVVTNLHKKEMYLVQVVVHFDEDHIFFPANSWIDSRFDNPESRIIFSNKAYLPSQTPEGLKHLRSKDPASLRGNGKGERKKFDRIYDCATYNDLGNPDKDNDLARPVLGGKVRPYPRRCRTGRPPTKSDPYSESRIEKPNPVLFLVKPLKTRPLQTCDIISNLSILQRLSKQNCIVSNIYIYYALVEDTSILDHTDEFNSIIMDLKNIDIEAEDEDKALILLRSLPPSYKQFHETIIYDKDSINLEEVISFLMPKSLMGKEFVVSSGGSQAETLNARV